MQRLFWRMQQFFKMIQWLFWMIKVQQFWRIVNNNATIVNNDGMIENFTRMMESYHDKQEWNLYDDHMWQISTELKSFTWKTSLMLSSGSAPHWNKALEMHSISRVLCDRTGRLHSNHCGISNWDNTRKSNNILCTYIYTSRDNNIIGLAV